ncbi:hypothetical protein [Paenibacillus xylanexedens]|uniref:hypothetical protein n=1 Tax=Paenibacillus xylanexedens TaxID=528191 RepID=UPI0011A589C7|nr:hypothetical protein [Paenibacillus xylanexedens]
MDIKIGDNNKIKNSSIGHQIAPSSNEIVDNEPKSKRFSQRHPILLSIIISIATGFILLFSFWKSAVNFIENLF